MSTLTANTLPIFNEGDERWVNAPLCVLDVTTHKCVHCGAGPVWDTYEEYVEHFWSEEYEGDRNHVPTPEEEYHLVFSLCVGPAQDDSCSCGHPECGAC